MQVGEGSTGWNTDFDGRTASATGRTGSAAGDISGRVRAGSVQVGEESTGWNTDFDGGSDRAAAFSYK